MNEVKSDTSKLPKNLIFPPGKTKGEQQTHTSLGGYNEPPLSLLPSEKIEYWPQLLLSTEAGEERYSPKLWCTQTGWLYKKKKQKQKNLVAAGCYQTSLAVSVDFSLTVILSQSI